MSKPTTKALWVTLAAAVFSALLPAAGQSAPPIARQSAPPSGSRQPSVAWSFDLRHSPDLTPHTTVFLRVGSRRILILRDAEEKFQGFARSEYKDQGVPASALTACGGAWAGQGDSLYVVRRGASLIVFRREEDEQAPALSWKRLQVIPLR